MDQLAREKLVSLLKIVDQYSSALPVQVVPSSALRIYPSLHVHSYDPWSLMQLWSQPPLSSAHSSMSRRCK